MRDLSLHQTLIAAFALVGITALGLDGKVSSDALVAVYSAIAGGALGYYGSFYDITNQTATPGSAYAVQVGTTLHEEGIGAFARLTRELKEIMAAKGYQTLDDFRGRLKTL